MNNISNQTIIEKNYLKNNLRIDIPTMKKNAENDELFCKLLITCRKFKIDIFNQSTCMLLNSTTILNQCNEIQKTMTRELSEKINNIYVKGQSNGWLIDIDNIYTQYKKKFKDIELIIHILKNIFNDEILGNLCCVPSLNNSLSTNSQNLYSTSSNKQEIKTENKSEHRSEIYEQELKETKKVKTTHKKENMSKYIAVYSS